MKGSVFISYSHESENHKKKVNKLKQNLQKHNVNVTFDLDQGNQSKSKRYWIDWMRHGLKSADCCLIIISKTYHDAYIGEIAEVIKNSGKNKGIAFETDYITKDIYDSYNDVENYFCVYFDIEDKKYLPFEFQGNDFLVVDEDISELVERLPKSVKQDVLIQQSNTRCRILNARVRKVVDHSLR